MLFVPTRDRPLALAYALRSHRVAMERSAARAPITVVDDSSDELATRRACEGAAAVHVGRAERARLVALLGESAEEREVLGWALLPPEERATTWVGATRNVIALLSAGRPFVSIDDDSPSLFFRRRAPGASKPVGDPQPIEIAPAGAVVRTEADAWSVHAPLLGAPAHRFVPGAPGDVTIGLTFTGVVGDLGIGSLGALAFVDGASRVALEAGGFDEVVRGGAMARLACNTQVSTHPFGMMGCFGADARRMLPPMVPAGRNEDGLFVTTTRFLHPRVALAHVPVAVAHRLGQGRPRPLASFFDLARAPRLADLLELALADASSSASREDPASSLRSLGRALQARPAPVWEAWNAQRAARAGWLRRSWRGARPSAVRELALALADELDRPAPVADTASGLCVGEAVRRFGALLELWPDVWRRAERVQGAFSPLPRPRPLEPRGRRSTYHTAPVVPEGGAR